MSARTEQLWQELIQSTASDAQYLFLEYCSSVIDDKNQSDLSVEQSAYKICGIVVHDFIKDKQLLLIKDRACELEIPREMSVGAGIKIGEKWDTDKANVYKEEGWQELVKLINDAKNHYKK